MASKDDELICRIRVVEEANTELCQRVARLEADLDATTREKSELNARYVQLDQAFKRDKKVEQPPNSPKGTDSAEAPAYFRTNFDFDWSGERNF